MFCPQDLVGMAAGGEEILLNGRKAYPVHLHMIQFTQEGMARIGQGIRDFTQHYGLPAHRLKEMMKKSLYIAPPNPSLYFLFHIPEMDADVHIEIPRTFWRLSNLALEREMAEFPGSKLCRCKAAS